MLQREVPIENKIRKRCMMSQELEIEFKNLLSKKEYEQLVDHFELTKKDFFIQENSYFDTHYFHLKKHNSALRIRLKKNFAELTLKTPHQNHMLETTNILSLKDAKELIAAKSFIPKGEIATNLEKIGLESNTPVYLIADLKTKRAEKIIKDEFLVVLDQSWYADTVDYELEVEVSDEDRGNVFFLDILEYFSIPKRETKNKIQRAVDSLEN